MEGRQRPSCALRQGPHVSVETPQSGESTLYKKISQEYSMDLNLSRKDGADIGLLVPASLASLVFTIALEPEGW